jgi:hypothetical protein
MRRLAPLTPQRMGGTKSNSPRFGGAWGPLWGTRGPLWGLGAGGSGGLSA